MKIVLAQQNFTLFSSSSTFTSGSDVSTSGFRKTAYFRFEVGTGNRKVDDAKAEGEIYTPSKIHSNLPSSFGGEEGSTLKKRDLTSVQCTIGMQRFLELG